MICKCCNNETTRTETCSIKHGMAWRYLKQFDLSKNEIRKILNIPNYSLRVKYKIYKEGLKLEDLSCKICNKKLSEKKILSVSPSSSTCSKECYSKTKRKTNCIICNKDDCKSQKCRAIKGSLNKFSDNLPEYIKLLKTKYKDFDLLTANKLYSNNLLNFPKCKYCNNENKNIFSPNNNKSYDCCSLKCGNTYKFSKKSYHEIYNYYLNKEIPRIELDKIDKFKLGKIYNNKKLDINKCSCGQYYIETCPNSCANRQHFDNIEKFNKKQFKSFIKNGLFDIKEAMKFYNCSETTIRRFKKKFKINESCKLSIEDEIVSELNLTDYVQNDRSLIYPKEIDILVNSKHFGIEYNGLIWHSIGKNKNSIFNNYDNEYELKNNHLNKTESMEDKGYQLYHIFEDEWLDLNKRLIWKSVINSKLGRTERIYARKCTIKEVSSKISSTFLEQNHLQGKINASIRLGLYYQDELVSLMTFGKTRRKKWNSDDNYELLRFCSKLNTTVTGGASKLIKSFERNYNPKLLLSYANRRWSTGNLYKTIGFELVDVSRPNYFYFNNECKLKSRIQFQKHKLRDKLDSFNPELTETENMYNNNYRKIYDSGNLVFIKEYKDRLVQEKLENIEDW